MTLSNDELRDVLDRAETIQGASTRISLSDAELETFILAAEEVGFSRQAVEQALREHLKLPMKPAAAGELTFARSADGKFYVAQVLAASEQGNVHVRFLGGGEHSLPPSDLRPCSFLPGERVVCPWPWWGPWTCTVQSFDASSHQIKVSDGWGESRKFSIAEVWLNPARDSSVASRSRKRISVGLLAAGAGIGALVGSILTAVLLR